MRICVLESVYLIWKIRCERVIERGGDNSTWHNRQEVRNRWYAALNKRLVMDRAMTSKKLGPKAMDRGTVLETWRGILTENANRADDWLGMSGVLVGKLDRDNPPDNG
ncbi:hypothetical protein C8Q76DRAFT_676446 [Earliella scabrosa]|nr:hypothetical protein C8Q76DRAFT_676446 [Earliella scabrosa]